MRCVKSMCVHIFVFTSHGIFSGIHIIRTDSPYGEQNIQMRPNTADGALAGFWYEWCEFRYMLSFGFGRKWAAAQTCECLHVCLWCFIETASDIIIQTRMSFGSDDFMKCLHSVYIWPFCIVTWKGHVNTLDTLIIVQLAYHCFLCFDWSVFSTVITLTCRLTETAQIWLLSCIQSVMKQCFWLL